MLVWVSPLLLITGMLAVVLLEVGAQLVASSRASALADAAALAAVAADAEHPPASPRRAAARVVAAGDGRLERCRCRPGARRAAVEVSVEARGIVRPGLGAHRQHAEAEAVLSSVGPRPAPATTGEPPGARRPRPPGEAAPTGPAP